VPAVLWAIGVVTLDVPCPLTWLEDRARAGAGMSALPKDGFVDHYVDGVLYPTRRTGLAQALAFSVAFASWAWYAANRRSTSTAPRVVPPVAAKPAAT
jgi:hypothetical protein